MIKAILHMCTCLAIVLTPQLQTAPTPKLVAVARAGVTTVTGGAAAQEVLVRIRTHELRNSERKELSKASRCRGDVTLCSIVDSIEIIVRGHPLNVPLCVFCDLADLHYAQLTVNEDHSILTLDGGDASTSYIVKVYFDRKMVRRRTAAPGEIPDQLLEETSYYSPVLGN